MLRERLAADLREAVKDRDARRACTLRLILAAIKDRDIAEGSPGAADEAAGGVSDQTVLGILAKMVRQREESARAYEEAGRLEAAAQEREEIKVIASYLPRPMTDAEVERAIASAIRDVGATSIRDMGRIMAHLKQQHPGRMDFAKAGAAVKSALR